MEGNSEDRLLDGFQTNLINFAAKFASQNWSVRRLADMFPVEFITYQCAGHRLVETYEDLEYCPDDK